MDNLSENLPLVIKEQFFQSLKDNVIRLPSDEFKKIDIQTSLKDPDLGFQNTFPSLAFTDVYTDPNNIKIYINSDMVPERWQSYLVEHECWETYLWFYASEKAKGKALKDVQRSEVEQLRPFHRIALLNELKATNKDGVLEEYTAWVGNYYQQQIARVDITEEQRQILQSMWQMRQEVTEQFSRTKHVSFKS